jgi:glutamate/tyrosine decarboxylase-like PLP-dependent enzyme
MSTAANVESLTRRKARLEMQPAEFRQLGHRLVEQVAEFLEALPGKPVTPGESPAQVREVLDANLPLPEAGAAPGPLLDWAARGLFEHSLFNGHPRFWGYVTSSAAPIGILGDFLAAAVNPNVGAWKLSPLASEMEAQTVRWIAELIGYPADCGGLLVSGGNMANFVGFLAARTAKAGWDVRNSGMNGPDSRMLCVYVSAETHTWIQKATDLFGLGTDSIRWIPTDAQQRMDLEALRSQIEEDRARGCQPFLVVGTAGTVSTGAVDPLPALAAICREYDLWFHVDGAYGAVAAAVAGVPEDLRGLSEADSVAIDPHKWLYAPLEAGCALVRSTESLLATFSYHPVYYNFEAEALNYFDLGPQNSRGFRALKVWLAMKQIGRAGYVRAISEDMLLARHAYKLMEGHPELQAVTQGLSITTFRYVPPDLRPRLGSDPVEDYLDRLNQELLTRIEQGGEVFLSNALVQGRFVLRLCIVNFRTSLEDIEFLPGLVVRLGRELDSALRHAEFRDC